MEKNKGRTGTEVRVVFKRYSNEEKSISRKEEF